MEFLSQGDIYYHFLTPKIFKFMKFIGHCSSVTKSFASNFASTVSAIGKLNNPETEALQKTIFSLDFILVYLFMSGVTSQMF